jgi:heat shock protein HtpX
MLLKKKVVIKRRLQNIAISIGILSLMALLLGLLAWIIFGRQGIFFFLSAAVFFFLLHPSVLHGLQLRIRGARKITPFNAPALHSMLKEISESAALVSMPSLYYIQERILNAFTIGLSRNASIVLTEPLIQYLSPAELKGVIAHEVSHIKNGDTWILGLANTARTLTSWLSCFGIFFLLFNVSLFLTAASGLLFLLLLLVIGAPLLSTFLFLALSRTREFDADIGAVKLTGDVSAFVSALEKLDVQPFRLFGFIIMGRRQKEEESTLRTHPSIRERIRRLHELEHKEKGKEISWLKPHIRFY